MITATVGSIIADESALKSLLGSMGASGNKPCALCANGCSRDSGLDLPGNAFVCVDELSWDRVILHTDETIWGVADRLRERMPVLTRKEFKQLETNLGFRHVPHGLLADQQLREFVKITEVILYDFQHVYLVGGIFPHELWLLLERLQQVGITWPMLDNYVQGWRWPKAVGMKPKSCFNDARHTACAKAKVFKAGASELLGLYEVLRRYMKSNAPRMVGLAAEMTCFRALCEVLDGYKVMLAGGEAGDFSERVRRHLDLYKITYPDDDPKFKHHMALHVANTVQKRKELQTCFVHERKHKVYKQKVQYVTTYQQRDTMTCTMPLLDLADT